MMLARGIGDNSAAYGEDLRAEVETILGDDHETTFRYAQWHVGDYITGTMGMQLEQEGAYIRFLMRLYQRGKPLPDDDRFMAMAMNLSIRVWKRVKDGLIAVGKIISKAGYLTNSRFEKERQVRAETMRKQAEAARLRWQNHRREKGGLGEVSGKFAGSLDETSPKLPANASKKPIKINDPVLTDHMLTNNQYPITIEDNPPTVPPGEDGAFELGSDDDVKPRKRRRDAIPEEYPSDFEEFWKLYPRREGKGVAFKRWQKLTLTQKRRAWLALKRQLDFLTAKANNPGENLCPHPATWINQGRFDDEPQAAIPAANTAQPRAAPWEEEALRKQTAVDEAAARIRAKYQQKEQFSG